VKITSPRLGVLNLKGAAAKTIAAEDTAALGPLFMSIDHGEAAPPGCDVLLLYCDITSDGRISNSQIGLREIIRDSGARVAIVATENPSESYIAAGKQTGYGRANLVLTLQRNGTSFTSFFRRLFTEMTKGVSMPVAWVKLAPQVPGHERSDRPATIFACEAGQIVFA
jgi:hypothetical protein